VTHFPPRCRAELPSTATPDSPIRCSQRAQCQRHRDWLAQTGPVGDGTSVPWACDRNTFDAFVPVGTARN